MATTIVWLNNDENEPISLELRPHVTIFSNEEACYEFVKTLPKVSRGITLVVTDPLATLNRLVELEQISMIYIVSSSSSSLSKSIKRSPKIHGIFTDTSSLTHQLLTDLRRGKSPPPDFLAGVMAPFQGFAFIITHPATWARAAVPAVLFVLLLFLFAIPGVWGMHALTDRYMFRHMSRWAHVGIWLLRIVLYLAALFLALILAFVTAQPLSAPALESLVRTQERELNYPNRPEEPFWASVWRSVRVAVVSLLISFVIFIALTFIELFLPPAVIVTTPLKFITTGFILAYDIIDYPLSLHLLGIRERTPWFRHYAWATLGFGLAIEVIFLIPGAFILLLPAGVCGATHLVVAAERSRTDQPLLLSEDGV